MNGAQLEHVLDLIDASVDANLQITKNEVLRFITEHEDVVVEQLRREGFASIPTSAGAITIPMSAFEVTAV